MAWAAPKRESFSLSLAGGDPRGGLRGGFQQNTHQFSRCALSGSWSPLIGQCQSRGSIVIAAGPCFQLRSPGFSAFLGPGAEIQLRPRCCLQGGDPLYLAVNCSAILFSFLSQLSCSTGKGIFLSSYYPASMGPLSV